MAHTDWFAARFALGVPTPRLVVTTDEPPSRRAFAVILALLFVASAGVTAVWCRSMAAMGEMTMAGGWTMSMAWMRMPGQTWAGAAALFVGMWLVMMVAMMLPSLAPVLSRYQVALSKAGEARSYRLAVVLGAGYFVVWTGVGILLFPLGACLGAMAMRSTWMAQDVPLAAGVVVLMAGALQFTRWKAHYLACCRNAPGHVRGVPRNARTAWQRGLCLGVHCGLTCANLTAVLVVMGIMNLGAMVIVTAAVTAERFAPKEERVTRAIGVLIVAGGTLLIARAANLV